MPTSIPRRSVNDAPDDLTHALETAGCLVVTGMQNTSARDAVRADLASHMAAAQVANHDDPTQFYPGRTRRVIALVTRSKTVGDMILHPTGTKICDRLLLPNAEFGYQLHVTAALEIEPGARSQTLHREEDSFTFFELPRPNLIVATMWAISDFTAANGATLLVPGSHRWDAERKPAPDEILSAEMPAGSVLFWLGGTLHGAGANTTHDSRYGVILTYSCGWLRQEENQYLDVPPQVADGLSPELRAMIGYEPYRALGISDATLPRSWSPNSSSRSKS